MTKKVLGRGLGALIPEAESSPSATPNEIDIDIISPNPLQPRQKFDEEKLNQLAASIRVNGVIQPLVVRPIGGRYQLVAGERRWMASQRAGLLKVPVTIREVADENLLELALIENIQREDLNPIEEAQAYQKLQDHLGLSQEELAERVGKERSTIANALRLLKLPVPVKSMVAEGRVSPGHARALLSASVSPSEMSRMAATMAEQGWSVRQAEKWAKKQGRTVEKAPSPADPNVLAASDRLRVWLGTKVEIISTRNAKGAGEIRIHYYSPDDLTRVYGILTENRK
jgi:ParB family transcriptional regulator, chromosome partitioning protein